MHTPRINNTAPTIPPLYARMIPGSSGLPFARLVKGARATAMPRGLERGNRRTDYKRVGRWLACFFIPRPVDDSLALYQLVAADVLTLAAACFAMRAVSAAWSLPRVQVLPYAVLVTLFAFTEGLYKGGDSLSFKNVAGFVRSVVFAAALILAGAGDRLRVAAALATILSSIGTLLLWRKLRLVMLAMLPRDVQKRNVLIVGGGPVGKSIAQTLCKEFSGSVEVRGFLDDELPLSPLVLGRIDDLEWMARAEFIDEVILAIPESTRRMRQAAAIAVRNHIDIRAVPDLPPALWSEAITDRIGAVPIVRLHSEPLPTGTLFIKRVLDIALAAIALVIVTPLMALLAMLVRFDSRGPAFYSAERIGKKGQSFRCFKFRTMVADSDRMKEVLRERNQREGPIFKIDDDPRVTRLGRLLRRYSLDELPQLWNVLRGEMSLVGPRPHPVDDVNRYELHHFRRLDVKPGLTGLWQITARKSPSFELGMYLDLTYIENWSLLLDLQILARTVRVLFAAEGV